jgi:hypothetical protein
MPTGLSNYWFGWEGDRQLCDRRAKKRTLRSEMSVGTLGEAEATVAQPSVYDEVGK